MQHTHPLRRAWRLVSRAGIGALAGLIIVSGSLALIGDDITAAAIGSFVVGGAFLGLVLQLLNEREDAR